MLKPKQHERGAFLVLVALIVIVLLGIGSLVLDLGRLLVLRTEMQNAVDAAALAAAAELDTQDDAIERAMNAARDSIEHSSTFARNNQILGKGVGMTSLPDGAFEFFCAIGQPADATGACSGSASAGDANKILVNPSNASPEAHYVRVTLDNSITNVDENLFIVDLIFFPLLRMLGEDIGTIDAISLNASALAGRDFYACDYPPMAVCDPFEASGSNFRDEMASEIGSQIILKDQGPHGSWVGGNFGFLQQVYSDDGKCVYGGVENKLACQLADESDLGCSPPLVTTKTGGNTNKTKDGLNTRFDLYGPTLPHTSDPQNVVWPPAPSITRFGRDRGWDASGRFGNGDWNFNDTADYNNSYMKHWYDLGVITTIGDLHPAMDSDWATSPPSRWELYNWEISTGHIHTPPVSAPRPSPERRMFFIAMLSCNQLGISGHEVDVPIKSPDGFAKIFITEHVNNPPNADIYGEYLGWGTETDGQIHVDIKLYE